MAGPVIALRPAGADDLPTLRRLAADDAVAPFLAGDAAQGLEVSPELYAIDVDDRLAGCVRLVEVNRRSRIGEVRTLMVAPDHRGAGVGAAALRALCAHAFGALGLHRVQAEVYGFNHAALAAFERAGFQHEGVRRRAYDRHGRWQDGIHLGRLADEPGES